MQNNYSFEIHHWEKNFGKPFQNWVYLPIDKLIKEQRESRINDGAFKLCSLTIEEGIIEKTDRYNREFLLKNQEENEYKYVQTNDIVINPMNLRFGAIAKSAWNEPVLVSGYYNVIKASKLVDVDYLIYFLKSSAMSYMYERVALGSLNEKKRVHLSELKKIVVPLPPLPEQRKIAKILSTWDKAIATTESLIATSQQQKKALMQQLLTGKKRLVNPDTGKIFEAWKVSNLGLLSTKIGSGVTPKGGSNSYKTSGIPLIRSQNILWGNVDLSDVAYIDDEQHKKMKGSIVYKDDVLLNITGASIGRAAVSDLYEANVNQHVCIIRSHVLNSEYLKNFLLSFQGQRQIEQFQAGGNRQGLNFEQIKSFKIPVPSLPEQKKIAAILTSADKETELLETKLTHLNDEKKALMQQLLTGKRRVKIDDAEAA